MKKILTIIFTVCISVGMLSYPSVLADDLIEDEPFEETLSQVLPASIKPPSVDAHAAIVMDTKSGRVLYERNSKKRMPMASTTKIMTGILALENGNLNDTVTVSKRAAAVGGSTINLRTGQKIKLNDLMYGLLMRSGNDAAIAVAEHIGGTVENFLDMMNKKARELGAMDTQFKSPHGLDSQGHYSTAYDLATIARYALQNPTFSKIVGTRETQTSIGGFYNTNEMLGLYPGADGVKTGYTGQAGRCLVTSATRDGRRFLSVVLNCPSRTKRAQSSKAILDYAFKNYKQYSLIKSGQKVIRLPVVKGVESNVLLEAIDDIEIPLREDEAAALKTEFDVWDKLNAPVSAGIEAGYIKYTLNGKVIAQTALRTVSDVRRLEFGDYFRNVLDRWIRLVKEGMFMEP